MDSEHPFIASPGPVGSEALPRQTGGREWPSHGIPTRIPTRQNAAFWVAKAGIITFYQAQLTKMVGSRYSRVSTMKRDLKPKNALSPAILHILLALASEDLHGYGITLEIARQSNGQYQMGPGTLYDNLKRLMDLGFVIDAPTDGLPLGESRRFYHMTSAGRSALMEEVSRLEVVLREARLRLGGGRPRRT